MIFVLCAKTIVTRKRQSKKRKHIIMHTAKKNKNARADCVIFATFSTDDYKNEVCLFDKYLKFYWGEM
jgi:hypothetical protein